VPDQHLFSALFTVCAAGRMPELLELAARAEEELQQLWHALRSAGKATTALEECVPQRVCPCSNFGVVLFLHLGCLQ
jgi:hypothetical protein